jgi:hypothetical protein
MPQDCNYGTNRRGDASCCRWIKGEKDSECNGLVYKRGCQENTSPSTGRRGASATSSPCQLWKTLIWCRAPGLVLRCSISAAASSLVATTPIGFLKRSKPCGCTVSTMGLSEARGLVLFRVVRGGIGVTRRLGAGRHASSTGHWHTHPRTRASPEPTDHHQEKIKRRWKGLFTRDAQAACVFSFSASKFSPFFQRVSVIAASLRANVRRAIVGLMPLASDA